MNIIEIPTRQVSRDMMQSFGGLNHTKTCQEGCFYDMKNLSPKNSPYLCPRERRGVVSITVPQGGTFNCLGMLAKDKLCYVADFTYPAFVVGQYFTRSGTAGSYTYNAIEERPHDWGHNYTDYYQCNNDIYSVIDNCMPKFHYNGIQIAQVNNCMNTAIKGKRQLISMGANVVIFPDKIMWNSAKGDVSGSVTYLEASTGELGYEDFHGSGNVSKPITVEMSNAEGSLRFVQITRSVLNGNTWIQSETPSTIYALENDVETETVLREVQNGDYWIDTSGDKTVLKVYSESTNSWSGVAASYVKISHESLKNGENPIFKEGDAVKISGFCKEINNNGTISIVADDDMNTSTIVYASGVENGKGWITVVGLPDSVQNTQTVPYVHESAVPISQLDTDPDRANGLYERYVNDSVVYHLEQVSGTYTWVFADNQYYLTRKISFERKCPEMDFTAESKNRIWGCKYGSDVNEIYACKLGDPTNWYCYAGIASDSYAVSLGTDGAFTGAVAYNDSVIFFKENAIHQVYGSKPANYQTTFSIARGIEKGSALSAVIADETLYYLSKSGVMAYSGGNPVEIGQALGNIRLKDGVGGMMNGRYYLCATDGATGERSLYHFNIETQSWYKEDQCDIDCMATLRENLYCAGEGQLCVVNGEDYDNTELPLSGLENQVEWYGETGDIGLTTPDEKYYSYFQLKIDAEPGSEVRISVQYDSSGKWIEKTVIRPKSKRMYSIPFVTPRCDHMKFKFHGKGDCIIYSVSKYYESGGDVKHG